MSNKCTEFLYFYKAVEPLLSKMKGKTAAMMRNKQQQMQSYQDFHTSMERYENFNLQNYSEMQADKLVITNPDNMELKVKLQELSGNLQNPYIDLFHWSKGEIFDLQAVMFAVKCRNDCAKKIVDLEKQKASTQRDMQDVSSGNKTVTTLFKSQDDVGKMAN